jgi:S-methylmethionine-dependent homocysteine/selenocysteine methylase
MAMPNTPNYRGITDKLRRGELVFMDGGISTELQKAGYPPELNLGELWGVRALYSEQGIVATREVHRRYVATGAEILMTNTFRLDMCPAAELDGRVDAKPGTWRSLVQRSIDLVRDEIREQNRQDETAVAFVQARPGTVDSGWLKEMAGLVKEAEPDLMIMEANEELPPDLEFPEYEILLETGVPLWVGYRRVVGGAIGVHGEVRTRDGDLFQRAAAKFEKMGIQALLVMCLPALTVPGVLPWLRETTKLPLGVYANTGRFANPGWDFTLADTPEDYCTHAREWVKEGAQIIGGCCGTGPEHIKEVIAELRDVKVG